MVSRTIAITASALAGSALGAAALRRRRRSVRSRRAATARRPGRGCDGCGACPILTDRRRGEFGHDRVRLSRSGGGTRRLVPDRGGARQPGHHDSRLVRGQPGRAADPRRDAISTGWSTEVEALRRGDYLFFTDWRGDPDETTARRRPDRSRSCSAAAAERGVVVKGLMWRSHLDKFAYSEEENQHLGDAIERGRRRGAARPAGPLRRFAPPEAGGAPPSRRTRSATSPSPAASTCATRAATTRTHRGDPQAVQMARQYGEHPPWHDVQLRIQGPVVGALDTTFRERWNDPAPLDMLSPIAWIADKLRRRRPERRDRCRDQPPDPPPCGPHAVQVLRTYPDAHFEYAFAPHGERSVARGYTKAVRRAQTPDLSGGPVPVVQAGRRAVRRRADGQPGTAPGRRGAAAPRRGRPVGAAAQPGRPPAGDRGVPQRRPGAGARLRRREPRGHTGLRARKGLRHRRRLGMCGQRQPQPPVLDPRQRTVVRGARRRPACSPATCDCGCCANTSTEPPTAARTTAWSTSTPSCETVEASARALQDWYDRWPEGPSAAGTAASTSTREPRRC